MSQKNILSADLKKLDDLVKWFESQEEVDIEQGLKKIKMGAKLIKASKKRLLEVENEFEEIRKDLEE